VRLKGDAMVMILMAGMVLIGFVGVTVVLRAQDPLENPSVKTLEFATKAASFVNTLSVTDRGLVEMDLKEKYDVSIIYYDGEFFLKKFFTDKIRKIEGKPRYGDVGHYVMFSFTENTTINSTAFIFAYPEERREELMTSFEGMEDICVRKSLGEEYARVEEC